MSVLRRRPGDGDGDARAILDRLPEVVGPSFVRALDHAAVLALGRYGARTPTVALRLRSVDLLGAALLASALAEVAEGRDDRDFMVGVSLHHVVAQRLGAAPAELFNRVADRLADGPVPQLLRQFGARTDITPKAFGWRLIDADDGPDFIAAL